MSALTLIALVVAGALAFVNGANDVSRGISTLVGAGVTSYRCAIAWGTLWTALGAFAVSPTLIFLVVTVSVVAGSLVGRRRTRHPLLSPEPPWVT